MASRVFQVVGKRACFTATRLVAGQRATFSTAHALKPAMITQSSLSVSRPLATTWSGCHHFSTSSSTDGEKKEETVSGEEADKPEEANSDNAQSDTTTTHNELMEKISELEAAENKARDDMLRVLADMENVRKIARKDVEDAKLYSIKKFAKSLLEVADNLNRALESVPDEVKNDDNIDPHFKALIEGVQMTETQLHKAFNENGVVKYGELGEKFDPHVHEAQFHMQDPSKEAGTVGQIIFQGYKLKDRVLRHAAVGVVQ